MATALGGTSEPHRGADITAVLRLYLRITLVADVTARDGTCVFHISVLTFAESTFANGGMHGRLGSEGMITSFPSDPE